MVSSQIEETDTSDQGLSKMMDSAFSSLLKMAPNADKSDLMTTIDNAVIEILSDLVSFDGPALKPDDMKRVQITLSFLEQCLMFKDEEFTTFAKKRAQELQTALVQTIERLNKANRGSDDADVPPETVSQALQNGEQAVTSEIMSDEDEEEEGVDEDAFHYEREERLLLQYAYGKITKRLKFLRGDYVKIIKQKQVPFSGLQNDGIAPVFFLSDQLPKILKDPFEEMLIQKRQLLERRVYSFTNKKMTDQEVLTLYEGTYRSDIMTIVAMEFDNWAGEMAKAGIGGLPRERSMSEPAKEKEEEGIGASLKKVFSFGAKKQTPTPKIKKTKTEDSLPIRFHKELKVLENKGVLYLSPHFSFSILSYIIGMSEKQFESEYDCIFQIVEQQKDPDVGPVISNLSRLYKFYDNIFFDLVIVVLFQRNNKFDINMLQAACMSQNFVADRLPLSLDELKRRPMEHAKYILKTLVDPVDKEKVKQAVKDYFYVHRTTFSSKVGKRKNASENLLKRQGDKLDHKFKNVVEVILHTLDEISDLKIRQDHEGVFLDEEINATIEVGIMNSVSSL